MNYSSIDIVHFQQHKAHYFEYRKYFKPKPIAANSS